MIRRIVSVLIAVVLCVACTGSDEPVASGAGETPEPTTIATETTPAPTTTPTEVATAIPVVPSGRTLDEQVDWVISLLNGVAASEDEIRDRFTDEFLAQIPPAQFLEVTAQLRAQFSETWTRTTTTGDAMGADIGLDGDAGPWVLSIGLDPTGDIAFVLVQPAPPEIENPPETLEALAERLGDFGEVSLLAAEADATCRPIHAVGAAAVDPIGSTFKLYVLQAVADQVAGGDLAWDDPVAIRDDLKSLPSGTFQDLPAGTEKSVREFAEAMISVSDNTATDHLIDLVGRGNVEAAMADLDHGNPQLNRPFLTTRELFVLKIAFDQAERDAYIAATADERLQILETEVAARPVSLADAIALAMPTNIEEIEWFASPNDVCHALVGLAGSTSDPARAPLRQILGISPGVPIDDALWSFVGFKGGSEPGVLSLAWYLERADGESFVYVVNITNLTEPINEAAASQLAAIGIDLLADA